jgi:hypothetical protein
VTDCTPAARQDPDRIRLLTRSPSCSGRPRRDKTPTASGSSHDRLMFRTPAARQDPDRIRLLTRSPSCSDGAARQDTARIRLHTRWRSCAEQCGATRRRPHQVPHTIVVTDSTTRWPMTSAASHSPHLLVHRGLEVERQEHQHPPARPEIVAAEVTRRSKRRRRRRHQPSHSILVHARGRDDEAMGRRQLDRPASTGPYRSRRGPRAGLTSR